MTLLPYVVPIEVREADDGPMLKGTILQEGRAAHGRRAEVFAPFSVMWPTNGISILGEHRAQVALGRAVPIRGADGSLHVETRATPAILEAFETRKYFSIEFVSLREIRTGGGVREIQRALVEAAALVANPEFPDTSAEVRARRPISPWWAI